MQTSIRPELVLILGVFVLMILLPVLVATTRLKTKFAIGPIPAILVGISAVCLLLLAFILDGVLGISSSWSFTLCFWALSTVVCLVVRASYRSRFALFVLAVLTVLLLLQHFADLSPVKPYKRFFAAIRPGMTEAEVLQSLQAEFPAGGHFPVPMQSRSKENQLTFNLDPKESAWNAEAIVVVFEKGQVVSKQYWRD